MATEAFDMPFGRREFFKSLLGLFVGVLPLSWLKRPNWEDAYPISCIEFPLDGYADDRFEPAYDWQMYYFNCDEKLTFPQSGIFPITIISTNAVIKKEIEIKDAGETIYLDIIP